MKVGIHYVLENVPHPWNEEQREKGTRAWCLVRKIVTDRTIIDERPVAIFNLDSDAETFIAFVRDEGHVTVTVPSGNGKDDR